MVKIEDSRLIKTAAMEKKVYEFVQRDVKFRIEVFCGVDCTYKIIIFINEKVTNELLTYHQTAWLSLKNDSSDDTSYYILSKCDNKILYDIYSDLYVTHKLYKQNMIDSPLFARYSDASKIDIDREIWLSCDYNMNLDVIMMTAISPRGRRDFGVMIRKLQYDSKEFNDLIRYGSHYVTNEFLKSFMSDWVYPKIKEFHTNTHGKEIANHLNFIPASLIKLILTYTI